MVGGHLGKKSQGMAFKKMCFLVIFYSFVLSNALFSAHALLFLGVKRITPATQCAFFLSAFHANDSA